MIKEAFSDMLISGAELRSFDNDVADKLFHVIRDRYVERVR